MFLHDMIWPYLAELIAPAILASRVPSLLLPVECQVIVASGLIAYLGAFTPDFRESAVKSGSLERAAPGQHELCGNLESLGQVDWVST